MRSLSKQGKNSKISAKGLNIRDEDSSPSLERDKLGGEARHNCNVGVVDLIHCTFTAGRIWRPNYHSNRDGPDKFNKKNRLKEELLKGTEREPAKRSEINKNKIKWVKRGLNFGRTVSAVASYLYSGTMLAIAGSYLFTTHSSYIGLWAANLTISLIALGSSYLGFAKTDKAKAKYPPSPRVQKIADELCRKAGKPSPNILSMPDLYNFAMVDMPG